MSNVVIFDLRKNLFQAVLDQRDKIKKKCQHRLSLAKKNPTTIQKIKRETNTELDEAKTRHGWPLVHLEIPLRAAEERVWENFLTTLVTTKNDFRIKSLTLGRHVIPLIETMDPTLRASVSRAVRSMEHLVTLKVSGNDLGFLYTIINSARKHLEHLTFHNCIFHGTILDYRNFARAISQFKKMESLRFEDCILATGEEAKADKYPLLAELSKAPSLTKLIIPNWMMYWKNIQLSVPLPDPSLSGVFSLPKLQVLALYGGFASAERMHLASVAIQSHRSLKRVLLMSALYDNECSHIASFIRNNKTLLESLELHMFIPPAQGPPYDDKPLMHIIEALKDNKSLRKLVLQLSAQENFPKVGFLGETTEAALVTMLEHGNYTLTSLDLLGYTTTVCTKKTVPLLLRPKAETIKRRFLALNQAGRMNTVGNPNASRKQWCSLLTKRIRDLDSIYYVLSLNPSLCDLVAVTTCVASKPEKGGGTQCDENDTKPYDAEEGAETVAVRNHRRRSQRLVVARAGNSIPNNKPKKRSRLN